FVKVSETSGCTAYSTPITIEKKQNNIPPEICMVTYDEAYHKNKILSQSNYDSYGIASLKIYKKDPHGNNLLVANVPHHPNQFVLEFEDNNSVPDSVSEKYFLASVDTCGSESPLSEGHQAVLLKITAQPGKNILHWQAYEGFSYLKYYIYRGTSRNSLSLL